MPLKNCNGCGSSACLSSASLRSGLTLRWQQNTEQVLVQHPQPIGTKHRRNRAPASRWGNGLKNSKQSKWKLYKQPEFQRVPGFSVSLTWCRVGNNQLQDIVGQVVLENEEFQRSASLFQTIACLRGSGVTGQLRKVAASDSCSFV